MQGDAILPFAAEEVRSVAMPIFGQPERRFSTLILWRKTSLIPTVRQHHQLAAHGSGV
jgi:hypothetical protein